MIRRRAVLAMLAFVLATGGLVLAQSNPFVGTWKLNSAKSSFSPGPGPRSQTRIWAADGKVTVEGVNPAGQPTAYAYTIVPDGKSYPATGAVPNGSDAVVSRRVDANTIETSFTRGGTPADTTTFSVSADGKVLTMTAKGTVAGGGALNDRLVLEKQ